MASRQRNRVRDRKGAMRVMINVILKGIEMEKGNLKIYYKDELNQELDKALEEALKPFGYERWASGMDAEGIRDISFDKSNITNHST